MRFSDTLGEVCRDIQSGTTRVLLFAALFALATGSAAGLALGDQLRAAESVRQFRDVGASIIVVRAEGRIDGSICDSFDRVQGVTAAGAIRPAAVDLVASSLPSNPIPTKEVSGGFPAVVRSFGDWSRGGVILSEQVRDVLGARPHSMLPTLSADAPVAGTFTFPDDGRQGDLGFSALVPMPPSQDLGYDECWIDIWPESSQIQDLVRTAVLPGESPTGARPTSFQLNSVLGSHSVGSDVVQNGLGRRAPVGAALAATMLGYVAVRVRRVELASARHVGVTVGGQASSQVLQALVWIFGGSLLTVPFVIAVIRWTGTADEMSSAVCALTPILAGSFGAVAGVIGGVVATRERYLFKYFRER